ncbi:teichoic acid biosynthesis protein [Bacillus salipaludis]|uniref:Teichoic acid biosynthesis protein n=1 Tax=Bacillus salipaludis TaxID=2547811 RepID=A0A4R5VV98_9BACI|nr:CDP-glycerol glycerophosphotransferase family protein [Bacillus salipaludis]TDK62175.1 teichoic acid biosynthesis protein [Bacillus salipaludis]
MSLSLIILPGSFPFLEKEGKIPASMKIEVDNGNLHLVHLYDVKLENTSIEENKNVRIVSCNQINLKEISTEFIMFLDKETSFSKEFFDVILSEIKSKERYDFIQLRREGVVERLDDLTAFFHADFDDIVSPKIIRKTVLNKFDFFNLEKVNRSMLARLYFELFKDDLHFKFINNVTFKQTYKESKDGIISEGEILNSLLFSYNNIEQKKFEILFKKALVKKVFKLIDNRNFVDLLPYNRQESILELLKELLLNVDDPLLKNWGLNGYIPFAQMVREGLFSEALYYMRILRGKRYWYNTAKELEGKIKQYPIEESVSWKITVPLRKSGLWKEQFKNYFLKWLLLLLSFLVKPLFIGREVWLVSERSDQAEDNGYYFFKYCRENYPNKKILYIIKKDSPHVGKIENLGNIIYHSSLKHWIYLLIAKKYISAWVFEESSYPESKINFKNLFKNIIVNKQQITLQHGVIIHNIAPYLNKKIYNQKLFIASSNAEKEVIKTTLGYEDEDIAVTGLSRFDNLRDLEIKKQILIMPTWRRSLFRLNENEFLLSEYFNRYYNLIRNEQFLNLIEKENIQVKFYIHNQMQHFINDFAFKHPMIQFLTKQDAIVSDLLKESCLLITDYSSVMADFLYMEKPVLLYQFDPLNNHHGPVKQIQYSDFGEVITEESILVNKISMLASRNFIIDKKYLKKSNNFFAFKDNNNNERIFKAIENLNN